MGLIPLASVGTVGATSRGRMRITKSIYRVLVVLTAVLILAGWAPTRALARQPNPPTPVLAKGLDGLRAPAASRSSAPGGELRSQQWKFRPRRQWKPRPRQWKLRPSAVEAPPAAVEAPPPSLIGRTAGNGFDLETPAEAGAQPVPTQYELPLPEPVPPFPILLNRSVRRYVSDFLKSFQPIAGYLRPQPSLHARYGPGAAKLRLARRFGLPGFR